MFVAYGTYNVMLGRRARRGGEKGDKEPGRIMHLTSVSPLAQPPSSLHHHLLRALIGGGGWVEYCWQLVRGHFSIKLSLTVYNLLSNDGLL